MSHHVDVGDEAGMSRSLAVIKDDRLIRSLAERTIADINRVARLRDDTIGVLVVDFEPSATYLSNLISNEPGFQSLAHMLTGEEAIEATIQLRPEVVLMDHYLNSQMSGSEAVKHLRGRGYRGGVIINSVQDDIHFVRLARDSGADEYLVRPFSRDELFERIRIVAERVRGASDGLRET
jgi:DNA-binding response OmpR family regulator